MEALRARCSDGETSPERKTSEGLRGMKLVEEMGLPNGLTAEVYDRSRPVAQDMVKVVFLARVRVEVKEAYFDRREHYEMTTRIFGKEVLFEHTNERTFVSLKDCEKVFKEFEDHFRLDVFPYISKPHFPRRFVLSKYGDIRKNPWKYGLLPEQKAESPGE